MMVDRIVYLMIFNICFNIMMVDIVAGWVVPQLLSLVLGQLVSDATGWTGCWRVSCSNSYYYGNFSLLIRFHDFKVMKE